MTLYWDIGKRIVESQKEMGREKSVVELLTLDLRWEFPDVKGFSARNLWKIRAFYRVYFRNEQKLPQNVAESDGVNLRQLVAEIPWDHNLVIINKVKDHSQNEKRKKMAGGWGHHEGLDRYKYFHIHRG